MQYQITPEDIEAWCEDEDNAWSFRLKMKDILVIYRKFLEYLEGQLYHFGRSVRGMCKDSGDVRSC